MAENERVYVVKLVFICLSFLRIVLFLLAFKYARLARLVFPLEIMIQIVLSILPVKSFALNYLAECSIIFVASYFYFTASLVLSIIPFITHVIFSEPSEKILSAWPAIVVFHLLQIFSITAVLSHCAMRLAEERTAKDCTEGLIAEFKEAVIVIDEDTE